MSYVRASSSEPYVYFRDVMSQPLNRAHSLDDVRQQPSLPARRPLNPDAPPFNNNNKASQDTADVTTLTLPELSKSVAAVQEQQKEVTSMLKDMASTLTDLKRAQKSSVQDHPYLHSDVNQSNVNNRGEYDAGHRNLYDDFPGEYFDGRYDEPRQPQPGRKMAHVKLPPFNGKDDWTVWINRFEAIARRYSWSSEDKLDQLLPCIQGGAAQFVFTQLSPIVLSSYDSLIKELNSRYRSIQTARVAAARFMNRRQKVGETAEEYASDLKKLYDQAHGYRDKKIRQEDLMRRFLDGLADDEISFQVEFHKEPTTIDEAVVHVVNYIQTRRSKRFESKKNRTGRVSEESDGIVLDGSDDEDESATRAVRNVDQNRPTKKEEKTESHTVEELLKQLVAMMTKQEESKDKTNKQNRNKDTVCFNCSKAGHFARNCPQKRPRRPDHNQRSSDATNNKEARESRRDLN